MFIRAWVKAFEAQKRVRKEKAQAILLDMARSGRKRPTNYDHRSLQAPYSILGAALNRWTRPESAEFDENFFREIRAVRPSWFPKEKVSIESQSKAAN